MPIYGDELEWLVTESNFNLLTEDERIILLEQTGVDLDNMVPVFAINHNLPHFAWAFLKRRQQQKLALAESKPAERYHWRL